MTGIDKQNAAGGAWGDETLPADGAVTIEP